MKIKVVQDSGDGIDYLKKLLYSVVDNKTALFLSGGKTPKDLYSQLTLEQKINPGAVAMVDERYGEPLHPDSNEKMFEASGLLNYFKDKNIPFYGILQKKLDLKNTALQYNAKIRIIFSNFPKSVGILGVGFDGHIASLPAGVKNEKSKMKNQKYVTEIDNFPIEPKERVSMTFLGLSMLDYLIVLVLGSEKKRALDLMLENGPIEEIPARFFVKEDISPKTILITDQKI